MNSVTQVEIEQINAGSEELRVCLNKIIREYNLNSSEVLCILSRISAGYIHLIQKQYKSYGSLEDAEGLFQELLTAYLTDMDMSDIGREIEMILKEKVN